MKSIGESAARMRQLKLAITWGHEKVAKELIFEKKDYKFRVSSYYHQLHYYQIVTEGFYQRLLE